MRLGKRLTQIESLVGAGYTHIWDCCCDHGLLGAALLSRQAAAHIHFVDIVPDLMHELKNKLQRFFPADALTANKSTNSQWHIHCLDVALLPLDHVVGKQLVIIAGVGGDLMTDFIEAICKRHPTLAIDFLLCPVHHNFTLRQQLIKHGFDLQREVLIEENQRFYEILLVTRNPHRKALCCPVNPVGDQLWHCADTEQITIAHQYLQKTIAHYQRMQLRPNVDVQHIIDAYNAVNVTSD